MERLDIGVDVLGGWELFCDQDRLVMERVIGTVTEVHALDRAKHKRRVRLNHGRSKNAALPLSLLVRS